MLFQQSDGHRNHAGPGRQDCWKDEYIVVAARHALSFWQVLEKGTWIEIFTDWRGLKGTGWFVGWSLRIENWKSLAPTPNIVLLAMTSSCVFFKSVSI